MKAGILTIGNEVTDGLTLNTNSQYFSKALTERGLRVMVHVTCTDEPQEIKKALAFMDHLPLIIVTGGLGPTKDDLTKDVIASYFKVDMVFHEDIYQEIYERMRAYNPNVPKNNRQQACFPEGALVLPNPLGTAPGMIFEAQGTKLVVLPGPPRENQPMFLAALQHLALEEENALTYHEFHLVGMGESAVDERLTSLLKEEDRERAATYFKEGTLLLRLRSREDGQEDNVAELLREAFDSYIFSEEEASLEKVVFDLMVKGNKTLTTVESCTGGLIAASLVAIPGSSAILDGGIITYSNEAKERYVGVKQETLATYGAVSEETAREMVLGGLKRAKTDYAIAVTGIAGPGGGSPEKPVGLTYIALASSKGVKVEKYNFVGERNRIRRRAQLMALSMLRMELLKNKG